MENTSGTIVQVEPDPENPEYYVLSQIKPADGPGKSLRYNREESLLLCNMEDSITVKQIIPDKNGLTDTPVRIPAAENFQNLTLSATPRIEDFVALRQNGVILANSEGEIVVYTFDAGTGTHKQLHSVNLNLDQDPTSMKQQVTCMALSEAEDYLVVATITDSEGMPAKLKHLMVFHVGVDGKLDLQDVREFVGSGPNSMYSYINFDYKCNGVPLAIAFQPEDERRCDVFAFIDGKLELAYTKMGYHSSDFTAIRAVSGKIVSIDYNGVMRILSVPE